MTSRDRNVLLAAVLLVVLAASWFLLLAPKRQDRADLAAQVGTAQGRLDAAQATVNDAQAARDRYDKDYAAVASMGKAVPQDDDVPSLVVQLQALAKANHVDFRLVKLAEGAATGSAATQSAAVASASGASSAPATSASVSELPPGASVGSAGFPIMPFSFSFTGSFFNMEKFMRAASGLTTISADGEVVKVTGRLLTFEGISLKGTNFPQIEARVASTAYMLPADEGLTGVAGAPSTPAAPSTAAITATAGADQ